LITTETAIGRIFFLIPYGSPGKAAKSTNGVFLTDEAKKGGIMVLDYDVYDPQSKIMLEKIAAELNTPDDNTRALWITRSVFMALRDTISIDDSKALLEQLPDHIKMLYTDGWDRSKERQRYETAENFYNAVRSNSETVPLDFYDDAQARQAVQAVFKVLRGPSTESLLEDIKSQLPVSLATNI
jgi:uncharacterized protein (DUF2267 family)